jgi:hypothetical protein
MKGKTRRILWGGGPHELDPTAEAEFRGEFARAFANWQAIEHELTYIFHFLVSAKQGIVTIAVYQSVIGFKTRIAMIDAAAHAILPLEPKLLKKWIALREAVKRRSKRRNYLAHYDSMYAPDKKTGKYIPFMIPYGQFSPNDAIDKNRLESWGDSFLACAAKLYDFRAALIASGLYGQQRALPPSPYKSP